MEEFEFQEIWAQESGFDGADNSVSYFYGYKIVRVQVPDSGYDGTPHNG